MGAVTRKRAASTAEEPARQATPKRVRTAGGSPPAASPPSSTPRRGPPACSPAATAAKPGAVSVPRKGSRGAAFLAAAGIKLPAAASPPKLSTKKASAAKAAQLAGEPAAEAPQPAAAARPSATSPRRNPLLDQALPRKLTALQDMFAGLQNVYEVIRKRGQRTTYQAMRQAVEEASGRRFLMSHLAQLQQLLPEVLSLEWVRLPVAPHSSRTDVHLLLTLDLAAAAAAAAAAGAVPAAGGGGELQAARRLLRCRLAEHLLESYRAHLGARSEELRGAGDGEGAEQLEAAAAAAQQPPVARFVAPFPEGVPDVLQKQLPPRPDAGTPSSRAASPAVLRGATAAEAAALTPAATKALPSALTTGRRGRPPMHPGTVERQRLMQRRLSFGAGAEAAAVPQATPAPAAVAAAAGLAAQSTQRSMGHGTPLDKLHCELDRQQARSAAGQQQQESQQQKAQQPGQQQQEQAAVHASQRDLAAALGAEGLQFGGSLLSEEDASLLASMPEPLRRMSADGIISLDTLRKLDAADQQHRRLSSKEAQQQREINAALGELPRTFSRLQRIFGSQGPNALKLRDVIRRIKSGAETTSELQIEAQLQALAQHAPEYLTLKPFGSCGTPAAWVNRSANGNALMARLRQLADSRLQGLQQQ